MEDKKTDDDAIKVIDRRRFREDAEPSIDSNVDTTNKSSIKEEIKEKSEIPQASRDKAPEINFPAFLMGMYTQTLIFMGEIPHPETNEINAHLEAAKQNIDILNVIEEKTQGNLSSDEENLFKEILTTLRLQYVKNAKK